MRSLPPRSVSWRRRGSRKAAMKRGPTGSCVPATPTSSASSVPASCRCRSATSSASTCRERFRAIDPRYGGESFETDMSAAVDPENVPFWPWGLLLFIAALYVLGVAALIAAGRREDARALAGFIPDCLVLVWRLARDRRISRPRRVVLFLVLGYLALPIDLVPDFLPGIGQLDDAVLLGLALRLVVNGGGGEIVRGSWPGPQ